MALNNYGVLKGHPVTRLLAAGSSVHYHLHLVDDDADYRIAVNIKSRQSPSELLYLVVENFTHPLVDDLKKLPAGFTPVQRVAGGLALDYVRAKHFRRDRMVPLPFDIPGPDNELLEKIEHHVGRALADERAMIYAFGEQRGPQPNTRDKYFGFMPASSIHDIHMNQGNVEEYKREDGVWQDGGMLLHLPSEDRWVAIFLAFLSQCWHTDEEKGSCLPES